jgi:hypothetical protein
MNAQAKKVINDYLDFSGNLHPQDFKAFLKKVSDAILSEPNNEETVIKLNFITQKLERGLALAVELGYVSVINNYTVADIEEFYLSHKQGKGLGKRKFEKKDRSSEDDSIGKLRPSKPYKKLEDEDLGKLVDEGEVPTSKSRADNYWEGKLKVIFTPNNKQIRSGSEIPKSYEYDNIDFLERFYNLKAIEFGNWLSQQDRRNYLAGLGISLYDLHKILGFNPKDISLKHKITVAFGARGRGSALAHFESDTFAINITRYKRPKKGSTLKKAFDRTALLTASGGVGSFAHEYGHALDYFAGTFIEKHSSGAISDGRSLRLTTNRVLMTKNSLGGLMEKLLDKIIWQNRTTPSTYFKRLKSAQNKYKLSDYYFRRNELFARAFEVYVHYKMQKKKYKNIFLAETKYDSDVYLSLVEMRKLEKDFDALINAIKSKI